MFRLADPVRVQVARVDLDNRRIDFELSRDSKISLSDKAALSAGEGDKRRGPKGGRKADRKGKKETSKRAGGKSKKKSSKKTGKKTAKKTGKKTKKRSRKNISTRRR